MRSKKGEVAILIIVLVVAVIGLSFVLIPTETGNVSFSYAGSTTFTVSSESDTPTGHFGLPAAKEYGGAIKGVATDGTRAFAAGRAFETSKAQCFKCDCLTDGITSDDKSAAEKVCADNCKGSIVSETVGPCNR